MATTERDILEGKVLPELQAIASSMGVQGYQRLRKADLIGAIIAKAQGVEFVPSSAPARGRRGAGATETPAAESGDTAAVADQPEQPAADGAEASANGPEPERRTRRRGRAAAEAEPATAEPEAAAPVEVSGNGGQPATAGAPPATLTEPSSNGEVAQVPAAEAKPCRRL